MPQLKIEGPACLRGRIGLSGAKNAALPIMIASLLSNQPLTLENVPSLNDVIILSQILDGFGISIQKTQDNQTLILDAASIKESNNLHSLTKMRAGILLLGPLGFRLGKVTLPLPGGDPIGARPIGFHTEGLEKMGASIIFHGNEVSIDVRKGLAGITYEFPRISVGATEALIMAACLAKGTTILRNVAIEPEVEDLITVLRKMGAVIYPTGYRELHIEGADGLLTTKVEHQIIPDRIECGSYMMACASLKESEIFIENGSKKLVGETLMDILTYMGVEISESPEGIGIARKGILNSTNILTAPWPGFATDLQAQFTTLCTQAEGASSIEETIFENRFQQIQMLRTMGANIQLHDNKVTVEGPTELTATDHAIARDIRASFSLVIAGLIAKGTSTIYDEGHLQRGYEHLDKKLSALGACVSWHD